MLRYLFGEGERQDSGLMLQVKQTLDHYLSRIRGLEEQQSRRWEIWVHSFMTAFDELEQSVYCSGKFGDLVKKANIEQMSPAERTDYHRYIYFYKNSFIRLFAILDKLGFFLNEKLQLNTEKVKQRFSYFTVLRQMHERHIYAELEQPLYNMKTKYGEAMNKLRDQRNLEIHSINYEAADDLYHAELIGDYSWNHIENLPQNRLYLQQGYEMVALTIITIFSFPPLAKVRVFHKHGV
jgi:hypothetical protein